MNKINLAEKLSTFSEHYKPRTAGTFDGHDLMVVTLKGPFVRRQHDDTDEKVHLLLIEPTGTPNTDDPSTAAPRTVI